MKVSDCKPGARVRYWPVHGQGPFYDGTVRNEPWQLGSGDWVVHLKDLDRPGRTYVHAALVDWLFLLEPVTTSEKEKP